MIQLRCTKCGRQEPLLLQHDDPDFDFKVSWWAKEHQMTHHTLPVWMVAVLVFAAIGSLWTVLR